MHCPSSVCELQAISLDVSTDYHSIPGEFKKQDTHREPEFISV